MKLVHYCNCITVHLTANTPDKQIHYYSSYRVINEMMITTLLI